MVKRAMTARAERIMAVFLDTVLGRGCSGVGDDHQAEEGGQGADHRGECVEWVGHRRSPRRDDRAMSMSAGGAMDPRVAAHMSLSTDQSGPAINDAVPVPGGDAGWL